MKRALLVGIVGALILAASPAGATAPTRTVVEIPRHLTFHAGQQCSFPIRLTFVDNTFTATVFRDADGDPVREIDSGHLYVRVTNLATGESVSYNISGPTLIRYHDDGSQTLVAVGPGLFSLFPRDVGGPDLIRTVSRVVYQRAPSGHIASISPTTEPVDVCQLLS
jgi:hypothetical protein